MPRVLPRRTRAKPSFHTLDGRTVRVPMMSQNVHKFLYGSGEGYQVAELPYWGGYSMAVMLPAAGTFGDFEDTLTPARLDAVLSGLHEAQLDLQMPKFAFDADSFPQGDAGCAGCEGGLRAAV